MLIAATSCFASQGNVTLMDFIHTNCIQQNSDSVHVNLMCCGPHSMWIL